MTIPATLSSVPDVLPYKQYIATGGQTVFPYPFPITQDSDLVVIINGVTQATDATYSVSGVGNSTGGNVTLNTGSTVNDIVTVFRDVEIQRLTQIGQNSGFSSIAFNAEFNNIYLIMQQLEEDIGFCLQLPNTNTPTPTTILTPGSYANKYLSFDANGNPTPAVLTSSGALTQAIIAGLLTPQTAREIVVSIVPSNTVYNQGDFFRYNAVGDGVAADTVAVQKAFTVGGDLTARAGSTFLVSSIIGSASARIVGTGTIKQSANAGVSMIAFPVAAPGLSFDCGNATYDGNYTVQGAIPSNFTVDFRSVGTSAAPTVFRAVGAKFVNACIGDIRVFSNQTGGLIHAIISNNQFLGGITGDGGTYGPRFIDVADAVNLTLTDNHFDFLQTPGSGIAGKAGLVTYYNQAESIPTPGNFGVWVRTVVTGNHFNNCGRDQAATQGAIDLYGYAVDAVIANNVVRNFAGRAICVKGSDPRAVITGNTVDTSAAGVATASTGIVCNPSTTTDFYNDIVISGNIVNSVSGYGILVSGLNVTSTAGLRQGVQIVNNIVRNAATAGGPTTDIYIQGCQNANISGNELFSNAGTAAGIGGANNQGTTLINNNQIKSPAGRGILFNAGDNNSLAYFEVDGNIIDSPGVNAIGCGMYFSTVGGLSLGRRNRIINPLNATAIFTDQAAVVSGTIAGSVLTIASVTSGIVAVGQLVSSASGAAAALSKPAMTIASFGTFTNALGTGTVNLSDTPTAIGGAQAFALYGIYPGTSEANVKTVTLNNNTTGVINVPGPGVYFLDTAVAGATGNLFYINGGQPGDEITLSPLNGGRMVTAKKNSGTAATGNLNLTADWVPTVTTNSVTFVNYGTEWRQKAAN